MNKTKSKKVLSIIIKIIYQLFIILCVLLIGIIVMQKLTDNNKSILGYRIFRVITGSMEPEYDIGTVVICKETNKEDIKVGDDIVYLGKYKEYSGKIIMHEVVKIDIDENGKYTFHAKGKNNLSEEDPEISPNQIYGVVKIKSLVLTILYKLATSIYSAFFIITVLVLNVFITFKMTNKKLIDTKEQYESYENSCDETEEQEDEEQEEEEQEDLESEEIEEDLDETKKQ